MYSSVVGALKGPLHGRAGVGVLEALSELGAVDKVADFVRGKFECKEKIMGFGQRVYKVEDPRGIYLRELGSKLRETSDEPQWFQIPDAMENAVREENPISVNVDFYSASVQRYLGCTERSFHLHFYSQ